MEFASDKDRAEFAMSSFDEMGKLAKSIGKGGKAAKAAKKSVDRDTIRAHAVNIATLIMLGLKDEHYGDESRRNTTTGPAYREQLVEAGFSEAKAKLFWEYGQLVLKEPKSDLADFTGFNAAILAAKEPIKAVVAFLQKQEIEKEADLKKVVQPKPEKTLEELLLEFVEKKELDLASTASLFQTVLDTIEAKGEAPKAEGQPEAEAEAPKGLSAILGAVQPKADSEVQQAA